MTLKFSFIPLLIALTAIGLFVLDAHFKDFLEMTLNSIHGGRNG